MRKHHALGEDTGKCEESQLLVKLELVSAPARGFDHRIQNSFILVRECRNPCWNCSVLLLPRLCHNPVFSMNCRSVATKFEGDEIERVVSVVKAVLQKRGPARACLKYSEHRRFSPTGSSYNFPLRDRP